MKIFSTILVILALSLCINAEAQLYSPTYFTKADFEQDIQYLAQKVTQIHPKFLDSAFHTTWQASFNSTRHELPDSITFNQCFAKMAPLLSKLGDGHTGFIFPYSERIKYMQGGGVTMPFTVQVKNDQIYINQLFEDKEQNRLKGDKILSINSIASKNILHDMRSLFGAEKKIIADRMIEQYFGPCFWMLFGEQKTFNLVLAKPHSNLTETLEAISNSRYLELRNKYYPLSKPKDYELNFPKNNSFAYMKIKTFADVNGLSSFLKNAFDTIKQNNCSNLIVDVRDNFGGNSTSVDSLLNYLTSKEYSQYASIKLRVSNEIKNDYKLKKPSYYKLIADIPIDSLYPICSLGDTLCFKNPVFKPSSFKGRVFVIVNHHTYSAAATFAGVIKEYKLGKIIGQPTGGTICYYGDFLTFKLPKTEMEFFVSPKEFIQYGNESENEGVAPDILTDTNLTVSDIVKKYE